MLAVLKLELDFAYIWKKNKIYLYIFYKKWFLGIFNLFLQNLLQDEKFLFIHVCL